MKYTFNILLAAFLLTACYDLTIAQDRLPSAGKVPFFKSAKIPDYSGDGTYAASIAYGHSSIQGSTLSMPIPAGTPFTLLQAWVPPGFASSMTKGGDGRYYITEFAPSLYEFNPGDGSVVLLGPITGLGGAGPNSIAYNPVDGRYFIATDVNLFLFDVTTLVATLIGPFNTGGGLMIEIAFNCSGTCYAYDLLDDNAYTVNINTGAASLLGTLGYDANFGQGMKIDHETGIIYLSAFNNGTFTGQLRTMDPVTGFTTLVVDWGFDQVAPFAIDVECPTLPNDPTGMNANPVSQTEIDLTWNDNSNNETNFVIQRKMGVTGTFSDLVTLTANSTNYSNTGLQPATEYCYRVRAINGVGSSGYSNEDCATTQSTGPGVPTLVSPANGSTNIPVNAVLTWNASSGAETYALQIALNNSFSPNVEITDTDTTITVPNLPHNSQFYWRVNATNSGGTSSFSAPWSFTTVSTVTLSQTISFPNRTNPKDYLPSDYKIVGLPGDGNLNVVSILSGTQGTDWEVYWDNGNATNFFQKYSSSTPFFFTAGAAYWIIRKGNLVINQSVPAASVNSSGYFEIPLDTGFNLITNPFTVAIDWTAVLAVNGLSTPLNSFNGSSGWGTSTNLQPFVGYFIDNSTNLAALQIPYPFGTEPLPKQSNPDIWRISVDLICNELSDKTTSFGVAIDALNSRDQLDFRKPRSLGNIPMVYFNHPDWDDGYGLFATDIRSEFNDVQTWNLKVNSELRDEIELSFSGIEEVPIGFEIFLIDKDRAKYIDLRQQSVYEFTPAKDISDFQILVGKSDIVNSKLNGLLPTEFALGNNFPNPFNPTTTFEVSVPQTSEMRLVVYNILGQEIKVLYEGTAEPGRHWLVWDGKDQQGLTVPSGIYLYNLLTNNGINISRKMVLMK